MQTAKPTTIHEYVSWVRTEHGVTEKTRRLQNHFESVAARLKLSFELSAFWVQLKNNLRNFHEEYLLRTGYDLLQTFDAPLILTKPFNSFLLKTFRYNVLENGRWPDPPIDGWVLPHGWYSRIHDIVRTSLVVKYLDGVEFIISKLKTLSQENALHCEVSFEAREEGYYSAHFNVQQEVEIPRFDWDTERIQARFEIQVTTQLQAIIRRLLHKYYGERRARLRPDQGASKWQWDYKSDEFVTNYLGHILHYVEGMIMEVRGRQAKASASILATHDRREE